MAVPAHSGASAARMVLLVRSRAIEAGRVWAPWYAGTLLQYNLKTRSTSQPPTRWSRPRARRQPDGKANCAVKQSLLRGHSTLVS